MSRHALHYVEDYERLAMDDHELCRLQLDHLNKGEVLIHASAVCKDNASIIFCGPTQSGKTTSMIEFCKKGWKCLGDDLVLLKKGYIYSYFIEPCYIRNDKGIKIPPKKLPRHYFHKVVGALTKRRPHILLTPEELGLKKAFKAALDTIVFLGKIDGFEAVEKIFNNTKTLGGFNEFEDGKYLPLMSRIIKQNINDKTHTNPPIETTITPA